MDRAAHRVRRGGKDIHLGPTEFKLLDHLVKRERQASNLIVCGRGTESHRERAFFRDIATRSFYLHQRAQSCSNQRKCEGNSDAERAANAEQ